MLSSRWRGFNPRPDSFGPERDRAAGGTRSPGRTPRRVRAVALACSLCLVCPRFVLSADGFVHELRSPFSPGVLLHGSRGNPALLAAGTHPRWGIQAFSPQTSLGNSRLVIPDPLSLLFGRSGPDNWFAHLLLESFDLYGSDPDEASRRIARELEEGIDVRAHLDLHLLSAAHRYSGVALPRGWGAYVETSTEGYFHIPGELPTVFFSPDQGLQPGNTLEFHDLDAKMTVATELGGAWARAVNLRWLAQWIPDIRLSWGVGGAWRVGHALLLVRTDEGSLVFTDNHVLSITGRGEVISAGMGMNDGFSFDGPFREGFPVNGHGFDLDGGVAARTESAAISLYLRDVGAMVWKSGIMRAGYFIEGDSLSLWKLSRDTSAVTLEHSLVRTGKGLVLPRIPCANLEVGWCNRSRNGDNTIMQWLSAYRLLTVGCRLPLAGELGLPVKPAVAAAVENGFDGGALPLRVIWTAGSWERYSSGIELEIVETELTFALRYRALGDFLFRPRRGAEIGGTLHVMWGFPCPECELAP